MRFTGCERCVVEWTGAVEEQVVRGPEDFDVFYRREYRSVLGLAIVLSGRRVVAEELTQEAFLLTYRQWDRVGRFESPGHWVRRVVANRSVSSFRRTSAEARALLRLGRSAESTTHPDVDVRVDVWREVRRLPKRQAQVVALTYLDDLSRREVARILDCGEETVKTHLDRARRTLALRLDRSSEFPDGR